MNKEVIASYPIKCLGATHPDTKLGTDINSVDVSLTIYKDGKRDVSCSFLLEHGCGKFGVSIFSGGRCRHLNPEESTK